MCLAHGQYEGRLGIPHLMAPCPPADRLSCGCRKPDPGRRWRATPLAASSSPDPPSVLGLPGVARPGPAGAFEAPEGGMPWATKLTLAGQMTASGTIVPCVNVPAATFETGYAAPAARSPTPPWSAGPRTRLAISPSSRCRAVNKVTVPSAYS